MIGQHNIINYLTECNQNNKIPRMLILLAPPHYGKRTLALHICKMLGGTPIVAEPGIDGVRNVIAAAYKSIHKTFYIFEDADDMSQAGLNALLKVTEDPPRQAYFILTTSSNLLETLHSRGTVLTLSPYAPSHLRQFIKERELPNEEALLAIANSPGQCLQIADHAVDLYAFAEQVLNAIHTVTGTNAMKIPSRLKFKEDQDGYDPYMFLQALNAVIVDRCANNKKFANWKQYIRILDINSTVQRKLRRKQVKKEALFDIWVLDVRKQLISMEEENDKA